MNRREFIRRAVGDGMKATTLVAVAASQKAGELTQPGREQFQAYVKSLEGRLDKMERRHARLLRATIIIAGVSAGVDLSLII